MKIFRFAATSSLCLFTYLFQLERVGAEVAQNSTELHSEVAPLLSVSQLSDVQPTDWAFQALKLLIKRYGCVEGYSDQAFRGDRFLNRYEFAAVLKACLELTSEVASKTKPLVDEKDLTTIQQLQKQFAVELTTLRDQVDALEARSGIITEQQFSTTTKLSGQVIFAANTGGFAGECIVDSLGNEITCDQPKSAVLYRASLNLSTSFSGTDMLRILVETGSNGVRDNAAGILEPTFGSVLDFSVKPPRDGDFGIGRVYYTFNPVSNLSVSLGPDIRITDFIDQNSYANRGFREFTTLAFVNNFVLIPVSGPAAGAALDWSISNGLNFRALYAAANAGNIGQVNSYRGTASFVPLLYTAPVGNAGLFGDTYQGAVELQYTPLRNFAVRLQYSGGEIFDNHFNAAGFNVELTLAQRFALFGRYGYSNYSDTAFGDLSPQYWMAGVTFLDFLKKGAFAGIAVGQPFIEEKIGNATQTNYEVFYNFPTSDNISITPLIQVVTNSSNRAENGTIVTGTVRTVFSF